MRKWKKLNKDSEKETFSSLWSENASRRKGFELENKENDRMEAMMRFHTHEISYK